VRLHNRIKEYRELRGFTIQALADVAGLSKSTVFIVETGWRGTMPRLKTIQKIARALNCTVDDLFPDRVILHE